MNEVRGMLMAGWSPVAWLRLVWGVWMDPLWYWTHVRARLHTWPQRAATLVQAALGALSVTFGLLLLAGLLLAGAGLAVDWSDLIFSALRGLLLVSVISLAGGGAPLIAICGVAYALVLGLAAGLTRGNLSPLALSAILAAAVGLSTGVFSGVHRGVRVGVGSALLLGAILGLTLLVLKGWAAGLAGTLLLAASIYLGSRWATRQVPDEETRKRLANPAPRPQSS